MDINGMLVETIQIHGSDLHVSTGLKPLVRIYSELKPMNDTVISAGDMQAIIETVLNEKQIKILNQTGQIDFAYTIPGAGRFRGNSFRQSRGFAVAFRVIPEKVIPLDTLDLSPQVIAQCTRNSGLILITGPTGSGKSTTLASIIDYINRTKSKHIITIEDPIEYIHVSKKCLIHQRQIGEHAESFSAALRSALREDPDIIMVGELRDLETIELALTAAETGHLVFGTLHTRNAAKTLDRIISAFPANQQNQVRTMAAESIRAIISQILLPRQDKAGMIPAFELLTMTSGIQNLIREEKIYQIPSAIQTGARYGMRSMEQSLKKLMLERIIPQTAIEKMTTSSAGVQMISRTSGLQRPESGGAPRNMQQESGSAGNNRNTRNGRKPWYKI